MSARFQSAVNRVMSITKTAEKADDVAKRIQTVKSLPTVPKGTAASIDDLSRLSIVDDLARTDERIKLINQSLKTNTTEVVTYQDELYKDLATSVPDQNQLKQTIDTQKFKNTATNADKSSYKKTIDWLKNNKKTIANTLIVGSLAAIAINAQITANKINGTEFRITSIRQGTIDKSLIEILYEPNYQFTKNDNVIILTSNSQPSINGRYSPINPIAGSFFIKGTVLKPGDSGTFTCITSYENQFADTVNDLVSPATTLGKNLFGDALKPITDFFSNNWWVSLIFVIFIIFTIFSFALIKSR